MKRSLQSPPASNLARLGYSLTWLVLLLAALSGDHRVVGAVVTGKPSLWRTDGFVSAHPARDATPEIAPRSTVLRSSEQPLT